MSVDLTIGFEFSGSYFALITLRSKTQSYKITIFRAQNTEMWNSQWDINPQIFRTKFDPLPLELPQCLKCIEKLRIDANIVSLWFLKYILLHPKDSSFYFSNFFDIMAKKTSNHLNLRFTFLQ